MCGRYGRWSRKERIEALLAGVELVDEVGEWLPRYNAPPGEAHPIIRASRDGTVRMQAVLWGLIPYWQTALRPARDR